MLDSDFKRWLSIFFIRKGGYKVTDKGREALGEEAVPGLIAQGKAEEMLDGGLIERTRMGWEDRAIRIEVVGRFLQGREAREVMLDDFIRNGMASLLKRYYKNSPYLALVEAGRAFSRDEWIVHSKQGKFACEKIYPWEMSNARIFSDKELRIASTKWLIWKMGKEPKELTAADFRGHKLGGMLKHHRNSPYLALVETGFAYSREEILGHSESRKFGDAKIYPWEMGQTSVFVFKENGLRIAATRWLVWRSDKEPDNITRKDFAENGLAGMLASRGFSHRDALAEAGYR